MTDRYFALTVLLDGDIREDDAAAIINAIRMIKGVAAVEPQVAEPELWAAEKRARRKLQDQLWGILMDEE